MSKIFDRERYYRERRPKNIALLLVLVGLVVLFFSITLIKMRAVEERRHERTPNVHDEYSPKATEGVSAPGRGHRYADEDSSVFAAPDSTQPSEPSNDD